MVATLHERQITLDNTECLRHNIATSVVDDNSASALARIFLLERELLLGIFFSLRNLAKERHRHCILDIFASTDCAREDYYEQQKESGDSKTSKNELDVNILWNGINRSRTTHRILDYSSIGISHSKLKAQFLTTLEKE